ncbi:AI-2E family transporter [Gymnodinialimonas ulvae]|uniref:AI-2E family transporter n=1 Tax=Gymnodinialimonas ulvae TaxID=3126504 RepID=UPI0030949296
MCALATIAAMDFGQSILAPVLSAVVIGVVLSPLTDWMVNRGFHTAAAAFAVLSMFLLAAITLVVLLEPTLSHAIRQAPVIWFEFESLVALARNALDGMRDLQDTVADALVEEAQSSNGAEEGATAQDDLPIPNLLDALSYGPAVFSAFLVFVGTLYFFLASRTELYAHMAAAFESIDVRRLQAAEHRVSRYLLTVTLINAGFGACVTFALMAIGMPQTDLWGLATFLLNYMLYLGPGLVALALIVVGMVTFDGAFSFLPDAIFLALNMVEAQFATPTLVRQHMSLNPLLVFLSLVGWLWLWGPVGGLVAIPVLVWALYMMGASDRPA